MNGDLNGKALLTRRLVESGAGGAVIALPLVWLVFQPLVNTVERQAIDIGRLHGELSALKTACSKIAFAVDPEAPEEDLASFARGLAIATRAIAKREALEQRQWHERLDLIRPDGG